MTETVSDTTTTPQPRMHEIDLEIEVATKIERIAATLGKTEAEVVAIAVDGLSAARGIPAR
jgi:hypothetical protein